VPTLNTVAYYERLMARPAAIGSTRESKKKLCAEHKQLLGCSCFRGLVTAGAVPGQTAPKTT